ncbi:MAG: hypothetical protein AB4042_08685 [Leptolyngbyaceae cyanobacterium]
MNRDADAAQAFLVWLLQNPTSDLPLEPSREPTSDPTGTHEFTGVHTSEVRSQTEQTMNPVHQHNAETHNTMLTFSQPTLSSLAQASGEDSLSFELGEMSAVQDRFYAVLKRRLQSEIAQNPPLFPWESEVLDYETEVVAVTMAPVSAWIRQIQSRLPVPMPEQVLTTLFGQCQGIAHRSLQQGVKLVQSVESLFPDEAEMLIYLAQLVLAPSFRDGGDRLPTEGFPSHYDVATPVQQMALSLMAAAEILDDLTLKVSSQRPRAERQWTTATVENIDVTVTYQFQPSPRLRVESRVPCASHLILNGAAGEARSHRDDAGCIGVELFDISPNQTYQLTLHPSDDKLLSLVLAIQVGE